MRKGGCTPETRRGSMTRDSSGSSIGSQTRSTRRVASCIPATLSVSSRATLRFSTPAWRPTTARQSLRCARTRRGRHRRRTARVLPRATRTARGAAFDHAPRPATAELGRQAAPAGPSSSHPIRCSAPTRVTNLGPRLTPLRLVHGVGLRGELCPALSVPHFVRRRKRRPERECPPTRVPEQCLSATPDRRHREVRDVARAAAESRGAARARV